MLKAMVSEVFWFKTRVREGIYCKSRSMAGTVRWPGVERESCKSKGHKNVCFFFCDIDESRQWHVT